MVLLVWATTINNNNNIGSRPSDETRRDEMR